MSFHLQLSHQWRKCVGIEYLRLLYLESVKLHEKWSNEIVTVPSSSFGVSKDGATRARFCTDVQFVHGDALEEDWQDADVVFMNCVCFEEALMQQLAYKCDALRDGECAVCSVQCAVCSAQFAVHQNHLSLSHYLGSLCITSLHRLPSPLWKLHGRCFRVCVCVCVFCVFVFV